MLEHVDELTPARATAIREHADQARASKLLATMRRDLELDCDPAELVLAPPDRSQLREMFRRFEFRNLLEPRRRARRGGARGASAASPGRPMRLARGADASGGCTGRVGLAVADGRVALATREDGVVVAPSTRGLDARCRDAELVAHDAQVAPRLRGAADDTLIAAYLIEPGRATYELDDLAAEYGVERRARAAGRGGDGGARARAPRSARLARADARAARRARRRAPLPRDRAAAHRGARRDGGRRRPDRHVPDGRDHGAARRPRRGARGHARTSSPARSSCSARRQQVGAHPVREARARRRGARARPATRPTRACCARSAATTRSSR